MALQTPTSRAFSLIELVLVVMIIAVIGAIAAPRLSAFAASAEYTAVGDQLNHFETAFTLYRQNHGKWPADRTRGVVPPELVNAGYLKSSDFSGNPLGGQYDWQAWPDGGSGPAGYHIGISSVTDTASLLRVDQMIDDGNTATGVFYKSGQWVLLTLER